MPKLTKQTVDAADIREADYIIWDDKFEGFGLRVFPSGVKSYLLQYRHNGRTRRITIGKHGTWTPDQALKRARKLREHVNGGGDPSAERKALAKDLTIGELCDHYLERGCDGKKPSTLKTDRSRIGAHIKPLMGHLRVRSVTQSDVELFASQVAKGKAARRAKTKPRGLSVVRGGDGAASRTMGLLGAIFTFAVKEKLRTDNPVRDVSRPKDQKRERYLGDDEMPQLMKVLNSPEAYGLNRHVPPIIKLMLFTGCRKGEIVGLRWDEVDLAGRYLHLRDTKTGERKIPLSDPTIAVLKGVPRIKGCPFVFPSATMNGPFTGMQDGWEKVRKAAGFPDVRLHDLRHTFATALASNGSSLYMIGQLLGHRDLRTTQRYAHLIDTAQQQASETAAKLLAEKLGGSEVEP